LPGRFQLNGFFFVTRDGWLKARSLRKLFDARRGISDQREISVVEDEVNLAYFSPIKLHHVSSLCRDFRGASSSSLAAYLWL